MFVLHSLMFKQVHTVLVWLRKGGPLLSETLTLRE